jgi:hypothetical protein
MVRVRKVSEMRKKHWQVGSGIAERGAHEHPFLVLPPTRCALGFREVIISHRLYM